MVGLDGGTLNVLEPLARRGLMPRFAQLMSEGRSGVLRSTVPWYTIPGWISLMTGVGPGTHGVLHWVVAGSDEYFEDRRRGRRFVTSGDIDVPTFWDVAGAAGKRVAIMNMPVTFPAWPVNGSMITGLLTPRTAEHGTSFPSDLLARFPEYRVDLSTSREAASPDADVTDGVDRVAYLSELVEITEGRARVGSALLGEDVDLGVVVFVGPDRVSHRAWPEQEAICAGAEPDSEVERLVAEYYGSLDRAIGALLDAAGPEVTVLVVADHGFGPPPPSKFAVNGWLRDAGYLRARAATVQRTLARRDLVRKAVRPFTRRWRKRHSARSEPAIIDWSRSTAYAVGFPHTRMFGIVVNRKGVKREGIVEKQDVPRLLARLREELLGLTDAQGRRVVRHVYAREELGATASSFPDLLGETEDAFVPSSGLLGRQLFEPFDESSGLHELDGVLVLAGPGIKGAGPAEADIVDVAPTVLGLLGIAAPASMEGKVRDELVQLPPLEPAPPNIAAPSGAAPPITEDQEREIEEHLRTLGYTE